MLIGSVTVPTFVKPLAMQDLRHLVWAMPRLHTLDIGGACEPEIVTWLNASRRDIFHGFYGDNFYSE